MKLLRRKRTKQTTFAWCPHCRFELCAGGECVSDNDSGVLFKCNGCGHRSLWWFDDPVPFLLTEQEVGS